MRKIIAGAILGLFLTVFFSQATLSQQPSLDRDTQAIVHLVSQGIPRGDTKFEVYASEMVRSGEYAYIGTTYDHLGTTYLLKKTNGAWSILASDGGVFDNTSMVELGIPPEHANELWQQWLENDN